jgi:hypothetical protein
VRAIGVEFSKSMLSWPPGLRETDGIWAKYWYGEVAKTTSFQPYHHRHQRSSGAIAEIYSSAGML